MSTIILGGDASIEPKHLSFLNGGTDTINGNPNTVTEDGDVAFIWQPSIKTVNYRGRVDEQRQSQNLRIIKGIEFG